MISSSIPDPQRLAMFIVASLVVLVTPGPAVLYIVARSIADGLRTGIASAIGMTLGGLVHLAILLAGFAAIVADSILVRDAVQLAGSVFLIYLGIRRLPGTDSSEVPIAPSRRRSAVIDAAIVNLLNPKAIVFLLAFLPQFAAGDTPAALQYQLAFYGIVFVSLGITTDIAYALAASRLRTLFITEPKRIRAMQRISGATIMLLGLIGIANFVAARS